MSTGDTWLILVIDDSNSEDVREIIEEKPDFLGPNIHVETDTIKDF